MSIEQIHTILSETIRHQADGAAINFKQHEVCGVRRETFEIDVRGVSVRVTLQVEPI